MYFKVIAISFFAAVAAAADDPATLAAQLPACAVSCLDAAIPATGCGRTDFKCQCGKQDQVTQSVAPCLITKCTAEEIKFITELTGRICLAATTGDSSPGPSGSSGAATTSTTRGSSATASSQPTATGNAASTVRASWGLLGMMMVGLFI